MIASDFSAKLALAMKVLSLSRGRLAAEIRVDKSVVARWLNGVNAPNGHNLSCISAVIGARRPGFAGGPECGADPAHKRLAAFE